MPGSCNPVPSGAGPCTQRSPGSQCCWLWEVLSFPRMLEEPLRCWAFWKKGEVRKFPDRPVHSVCSCMQVGSEGRLYFPHVGALVRGFYK